MSRTSGSWRSISGSDIDGGWEISDRISDDREARYSAHSDIRYLISGTMPSATHRLYYTDAYRTTFGGAVVDRSADGTRIYLDETAFYPTSGGQPFDLGTLGGIAVADVIDEDE